MADPVSILGTVVGVTSLAIQLTQILHEYCDGVSGHKDDVEYLLTNTEQLKEVLVRLEDFIRKDSLKLSQSFTATSTLYLTNTRCNLRLTSLLAQLQNHVQGSKTRQAITALKWPWKTKEMQNISAELRGYTQTFHYALTLDGCELLLKSSSEVTQTLQISLHSATITDQNAINIGLILSTVTPLSEATLAIERGVQKLVDENFLKWLGATDPSARHQMIKKKRSPNTGQWIFHHTRYKRWEAGALPILWAQGIPGAGKSVLMSHVIDKVKADAGRDEGVAYFYCDYSQATDAQTPEVILASFSYQLIRKLDSIPIEVDHIYRRHLREGTRPDLSEYVEILEHISRAFSKVRLLIDAFDELEADSRYDLIGAMESLLAFTALLISSRPQSVDSEKLEKNSLHCTISAQREDLTAFVHSRLATASRGLRESPGWDAFASDTMEKLVTMADGMFILVSLQLDMLLRLHTVAEMRRALKTISGKVDDFYKITLERIRAGNSDVPLKILTWLVTFPVPLTIRALREALAVEDSTTLIDPDALIPEDDIITMCFGLVMAGDYVNGTDRKLSLAHATVHDYLSKNLELLHGFDRVIAETCVKYMNITKYFSQTGLDDLEEKRFMEVWENLQYQHPFLQYAAEHLTDCVPHSKDPNELQARKFSDRFSYHSDTYMWGVLGKLELE